MNAIAQINPVYVRLSEVPALPCMSRRQGKTVHLCTVRRWTLSGIRGHKLRTIRQGGAVVTTQAWLDEFFQAISGAAVPASIIEQATAHADPKPEPRIDRAARKASAHAANAAAGWS